MNHAMNAFQRLAGWIDRACDIVDRAARGAVILFTGVILVLLVLQVVMRYLIREPLIWVEELTSYTLAFLVLWGAACYVRSWRHVRVNTLYVALPHAVRAALAVGINILLVYFGYLLATSGHRLALLGTADLSPSGTFNLYWPRQAMTTGGALIILQASNNVLRVLAGRGGPLTE